MMRKRAPPLLPTPPHTTTSQNMCEIFHKYSVVLGGPSMRFDFASKPKLYCCSVTGVTWDDGCFFCNDGSVECIQYGMNGSVPIAASFGTKGCANLNYNSTCVAKNVTVSGNITSSNECDLKVYVVWSGTDSAGDYFRSAGLCL